jgi:hypothetical protein
MKYSSTKEQEIDALYDDFYETIPIEEISRIYNYIENFCKIRKMYCSVREIGSKVSMFLFTHQQNSIYKRMKSADILKKVFGVNAYNNAVNNFVVNDTEEESQNIRGPSFIENNETSPILRRGEFVYEPNRVYTSMEQVDGGTKRKSNKRKSNKKRSRSNKRKSNKRKTIKNKRF